MSFVAMPLRFVKAITNKLRMLDSVISVKLKNFSERQSVSNERVRKDSEITVVPTNQRSLEPSRSKHSYGVRNKVDRYQSETDCAYFSVRVSSSCLEFRVTFTNKDSKGKMI